MKKRLALVLLAVMGSSFAMDKNCNDHTPAQILEKLNSKNHKQVSINYSQDQAQVADKFQSALQQGGISVTMNQVSGTGVCNFSK